MSGQQIATVEHDRPEAGPRVPSNPEAEAALLGVLLSENGMFDLVADIVSPSDFHEPLHGRIYEIALAEVMAGRPANPVTLRPHFADDPAIADLGGVGYLARLTGDLSGFLSGPRDLALHVRELSRRRFMMTELMEAVRSCGDLSVSRSAIADMASSIDAEGPDDDLSGLSGGECIEAHARWIAEGNDGVSCGIIPSLDGVLGTLRPAELVICAARPSMGKTATAISYSLGAARLGHGVLFVSLEMSGADLGARMAANWLHSEGRPCPFAAIHSGRLSDDWRHAVSSAANAIHRLPLTVIDASGLSVGRLGRIVRRQARRFDARGQSLRLVVVDYLQLLRADRNHRSAYEAVSEVSQKLKDIAKENGVAVMALSQLSRAVEQRADKRPVLSDLRESGQIEQDADGVLFLLRPEYYLAQCKPAETDPKFDAWQAEMDAVSGTIEFIVAKRRNGVTGTATGQFSGKFQAVSG